MGNVDLQAPSGDVGRQPRRRLARFTPIGWSVKSLILPEVDGTDHGRERFQSKLTNPGSREQCSGIQESSC